MLADDKGGYGGRTSNTGDEEFIRFTGSSRHVEELYLDRHAIRPLIDHLEEIKELLGRNTWENTGVTKRRHV